MEDTIWQGLIAVVISILFFGSFALPLKSKRVQDAGVDPVVFQLYYSFSIFVTSWLACIYQPFEFDYHGILAALLWVPASILSIFAINFIGLSVAQGLWSGVTIVVSFCWGLILQHTQLRVPWAVSSMVVLMIGIVLVANCKNKLFFRGPMIAPPTYTVINEDTPISNDAAPPQQGVVSDSRKKVVGFVCAFVLGLLNGSMLVPTLHLKVSAYQFVPNFGIGALVITPVFALFLFCVYQTCCATA